MKKNISLTHALYLLSLLAPSALLSMENENKKNFIAESVIGTHVPTERGLGVIESVRYGISGAVWGEAEVVYADLTSGKFNSNNQSYHHKLDNAIDAFISNENNNRITETLEILREKYPKHKITDSSARKTHEFLAKENKKIQDRLKTNIQTQDREFINQENNILEKLQSSVKQHVQDMRDLQVTHFKKTHGFTTEKNEIVEGYITKECNEIRRIKTGLTHVHQANKSFKLPKEDGYCSDNETTLDHYNDLDILDKIEMTKKMTTTQEQLNELLIALTDLEFKINALKSLQY